MELFKKPNKYLYKNYDANIFPFKKKINMKWFAHKGDKVANI